MIQKHPAIIVHERDHFYDFPTIKYSTYLGHWVHMYKYY